jgi:F-type H+-transporting ATPase subunit gamma
MSETTAVLRKKIVEAGDLQSVVRTMKAVAASSVGQYEKSVSSLVDYNNTVELGLAECFRQRLRFSLNPELKNQLSTNKIVTIVFGSDQGLVGQFNELVADFAINQIKSLGISGKPTLWAVGERVHSRLVDAGFPVMGLFDVPSSINLITPLVGQILVESEKHQSKDEEIDLYLFYNRPKSGAVYAPVGQRLLPLDEAWRQKLIRRQWPSKALSEIVGDSTRTLRALIREYLFVSIFRACAESLASENASRLAAMQRAEKNIEDLLEELNGKFHRLRQSGIDEELFDVISSFEALK